MGPGAGPGTGSAASAATCWSATSATAASTPTTRATGAFRAACGHEDGSPIEIEGLWALRFGNGVTGNPTTLLFTAGIDDEAHGLFGAIEAAS